MKTIFITVSAILFWALLSVVSRILLVNYEFNPWLFSFLQLVAGGAALLGISLRRGAAWNSFNRTATWVLGALRVLSTALYTSVLAALSVLEAGILGAVNLPVIALVVWILSKRRPRAPEWVGHALILLAVVLLTQGLEEGIRNTALGLMGLNAICVAAMNLIAERHPENSTDSPVGRAWFSGVVLVITAAVFLAVRLLHGDGIAHLFDTPLVVASIAVGVLLRAPAMFLAFWSIRAAGAQGYTAAIALLPLFGMAFEQSSVWVGLLDVSRFQMTAAYLAVIALAGTLIILAARSAHVLPGSGWRQGVG
ncbi:MAG: EamA family transporter [Pseudomonadota bacterium]